MPLHSLFVLNLQAKILYTRYYDPACLRNPEERRQWERVLFRNARPMFKDALVGPQFFEEGPTAVVFTIVNDLVLLLAGTDECDTLLLLELLSPLQKLLAIACDAHAGKGAAAAGDEASFLHADSFGKWSCLVDEMVPPGGIVEHVDADVIEKLAKAKPLA